MEGSMQPNCFKLGEGGKDAQMLPDVQAWCTDC